MYKTLSKEQILNKQKSVTDIIQHYDKELLTAETLIKAVKFYDNLGFMPITVIIGYNGVKGFIIEDKKLIAVKRPLRILKEAYFNLSLPNNAIIGVDLDDKRDFSAKKEGFNVIKKNWIRKSLYLKIKAIGNAISEKEAKKAVFLVFWNGFGTYDEIKPLKYINSILKPKLLINLITPLSFGGWVKKGTNRANKISNFFKYHLNGLNLVKPSINTPKFTKTLSQRSFISFPSQKKAILRNGTLINGVATCWLGIWTR